VAESLQSADEAAMKGVWMGQLIGLYEVIPPRSTKNRKCFEIKSFPSHLGACICRDAGHVPG
jgi:hypothetical protein